MNSLKERIDRAASLVDLNAPDPIVAMSIHLVWKAAWLEYPDAMAREYQDFIVEKVRQNAGLCNRCDNPIDPKLSFVQMCDECSEKIIKDIIEDEE